MRVCEFMCACAPPVEHQWTCAHLCACVGVCVSVCVCVCLCVCVCVCVCEFVHWLHSIISARSRGEWVRVWRCVYACMNSLLQECWFSQSRMSSNEL